MMFLEMMMVLLASQVCAYDPTGCCETCAETRRICVTGCRNSTTGHLLCESLCRATERSCNSRCGEDCSSSRMDCCSDCKYAFGQCGRPCRLGGGAFVECLSSKCKAALDGCVALSPCSGCADQGFGDCCASCRTTTEVCNAIEAGISESSCPRFASGCSDAFLTCVNGTCPGAPTVECLNTCRAEHGECRSPCGYCGDCCSLCRETVEYCELAYGAGFPACKQYGESCRSLCQPASCPSS